jgi:hypothetical protein
MKTFILINFIFLIGITFSQKESKDSICFFVSNNISINDEEPWSIVFDKKCSVQKFNFQIYNRWGSLLFKAESIEEANKFNPFASQKKSKVTFETGTYYWVINYRLQNENNDREQKGFLNILH